MDILDIPIKIIQPNLPLYPQLCRWMAGHGCVAGHGQTNPSSLPCPVSCGASKEPLSGSSHSSHTAEVPVRQTYATHMVRNHQGGYPYINLSLFFFWKYTETSFFLEKFIGQWILDRDRRGIARDIKKSYLHFQNLTKNSDKGLDNLKSWNDPSLLVSLHFFCWKYTELSIFFGKIYLSMNSGPQWAGDC